MKVTRRQLRRIIKEAIKGHVHGNPAKPRFLDLVMSAMAKSDYRRAANAIMDSYMIDDVSSEDEDSLLDALAALPPDVRDTDLERVADRWFKSFRGESEDSDREELMNALQKEYKLTTRTTEEFGISPGGIWIAAEAVKAQAPDGLPLFDYYMEDEPYVFGVHEEFEDFLKPYGFFPEWHDPGTLMLWRT